MTSRERSRLSPVVDEIVIDDLAGVALADAAAAGLPVRWANPAFAALVGRSGDQVAGRRLDRLIDEPQLADAIDGLRAGGERTVRVAPAGGRVVLQLSPTDRPDEVLLVAVPAHATARAAMYDAVTGLATVALFDDHLQMALRRRAREGQDLAVAAISAPHFATAWQEHEGSTASVLQARMAERIEQVLRDSDVLAARRPGHFLLLLVDPRDAVVAATLASERLFEAFSLPMVLPGGLQPLDLTIGIGGATHDDVPARVIARADVAHARAAAAGLNRYRVDQPEV